MRLALRLVSGLLLASLVSLAFADPVTGGYMIGTYFLTYFTIAEIVVVVGLSVYGSSQQRRAARKAAREAKESALASLEDRTLTSITSESPFVYVYGKARVGSVIVALFTAGANDEYKYLVCIHAAHECHSVANIWISGKDIGPLDVNGYVTGGEYAVSTETAVVEVHAGASFSLGHVPVAGSLSVYFLYVPVGTLSQVTTIVGFTLVGDVVTLASGYSSLPGYPGNVKCQYRYYIIAPRLRIYTHLGVPGEPVDAQLHADLPALWPTTATLSGFCYSVVRLDLNQPEFQGGVPTIEVLLYGKKVYDPRSTLTVWSQNNALCIYDYLTSELCGIPAADLPTADFITAANVCDESRSIFASKYSMNGTVTSDEKQPDVLQTMADSMAGTIVDTTWNITAGKYIAPVASLDQSDIIGQISINPGTADSVNFNGVKGQYISPENAYVATDFKPYRNAVYAAADGRDLWTNIDFRWTDTLQAVHDICRIMTEDSRNAYTIKAEFSLKAWPLKVGERITFTSVLFGITDKIFRITDKKYIPNGFIELTMKEDAVGIWDYADAVVPDSTPNTNLRNPYEIDPLTSLTLDSGADQLMVQTDGTVISRIHAVWPRATTAAVFTNGIIEIEWLRLDATVAHKTTVSGGDTEAHLTPVEDGAYYTVRARAVNPYLNVKSSWVYAALHQVLGKMAPPADVTNFSIDGTIASWDKVPDKDLAGYRFKFNYGDDTDWTAATLLYSGIVTHSPFDLQNLPFGQVTIMIKAVDTSGNESVNSTNIFTDLGDPLIRNVVATIPFDPTYPGTLEGCTVVSGDLVADALDSFYGTDDQSFYGPDASPFYDESAYGEMVYISDPFTIPIIMAGCLAILDITTLGKNISIEYRNSPP